MSGWPLPPPCKIAFILASTGHGAMIVNRFDYKMQDEVHGFGVGFKLLDESSYELSEISIGSFVLAARHRHFGSGVVAIDCGANVGTHTVEWARQMTGWGSVTAIEAQERVYYALAGNVAVNNCFNARVIHAAVGDGNGMMKIPNPDYVVPTSFGSLELKPSGMAGNLATDLCKVLHRPAAERWLEGRSEIEENHHVASQLRLAQLAGLQAVLGRFDSVWPSDRDAASRPEAQRFSLALKQFLAAETTVAERAGYTTTSDLTVDERRTLRSDCRSRTAVHRGVKHRSVQFDRC